MQHNDTDELRRVIREVHGCASEFVGCVRVRETFGGQPAWEGIVYIFKLDGCRKADRCYAWSYEENGETKTTTVLAIPPVTSPETAVQVAIAAKARQK